MPQRTKIIIYAVLALLAIWIGWKVLRSLEPAFAEYRLKRQFSQIEPWTASTNYSTAGWKQLLRAAQALQKATPSLAGTALENYLKRYASRPEQLPAEQAKLFLLLRFAFQLPDAGAAAQRDAFGGPNPRGSDANGDGTYNMDWPIAWTQGRPRLIAGFDGTTSGPYRVKEDFDFLRFKFRPRDLAKVQLGGVGY